MKKLIFSAVLIATAVFSLVIVTSFGCGSPDQLGKGGNSGGGEAGTPLYKLDGSVSSNGGGGEAGTGGGGPPPTGDANCGSQTNSTSREPADVLLVLDRSGSMSLSIAENCYCDEATRAAGPGGNNYPLCSNTTSCTTRWASVSSALQTTLAATPQVRWGLKLFSTPGGNQCAVSNTVEVPVGTNSSGAIQTQMTSVSPANNTPTAAAITAAAAYLKGLTDNSNKVILLATDGEPNCKGGSGSTSDVPGTTDAISKAGFQVYVVGIGPSVSNLDTFATAGGTSKAYLATSPEALATALAAIGTAVASCSFTLATKPPDPNNVWVYLDGNFVTKDDPNGWSFAGNTYQTIVLNGSACEQVKAGDASTVQVLFGCPGTTPPIKIW
jgi:hypothetical protein